MIARWTYAYNANVGVAFLDGDDHAPTDVEYVLAADYERDVAAAEERGWKKALDAVQARVSALPVVGRLAGTDSTLAAVHVLQAIAALRKPTEAQT